MNIQIVLISVSALFIIGLFSLFLIRGIVNNFISYNLITISALINFLIFSKFIYVQQTWDKIFIIFGSLVVYLFMFSLGYYLYSSLGQEPDCVDIRNYWFVEFRKSDWWGEDKY